MSKRSLQEVQELFSKDRFATENGMIIDAIAPSWAKCSLTIEDKHRNALGAIMGGVYFTLADFAFAVASNWEKIGVVSLTSNITYLGAAKGSKLIAEAKCVKNGRSTCCYQTEVRDDLDNLAAVVTTTGYRKT